MSDPRPKELIRFLELLTKNAPDGYDPWLFRVEEGQKNPDLSYGSWKEESAKLTKAEAVQWMETGGNVGIAGRPDDCLINVDIDDEDETTAADLKDTLIARSRSRTGIHGWYFEAPDADIPNIPTDDAGEVRANWQYVVAPGSYVETDPDSVPDGEQTDAGYYTIQNEDPVAKLTVDELPDVFQEANRDESSVEATGVAADDVEQTGNVNVDDDLDERQSESELFDISAKDVALKEGGSTNAGERWAALFHDSDTGKNMSLSDEGLLHCWRHEVAHNGLQALCVLSDYSGDCQSVGSPHKRSGATSSCLANEDGAHIWHAWKYAKENGYIPNDDPVPYAALKHLCRTRGLCTVSQLPTGADDTIPASAYDAAISSIANHDELDPGRKKTDEIANDGDSGVSKTPPSSVDSDEGEDTKSDGGADVEESHDSQTESPDGPEKPSTFEDWKDIRQMFRESENAEERAVPRFESAMKLHNGESFANLQENETLYAYDTDRGIYEDNGVQVIRQQLTEGLEEQYRGHTMSEIEDHIRGRNTIPQEKLGGPEGKIAARNCVIDLKNEKTLPHSPEFMFQSRLGTEFDSSATCPQWKAFLDDAVPSETQRQKLQEFVGYCLHHWGLPYHKALFLVGPTASGKSTFLDTVNELLGSDTVASLTPQQLTSERFGPAELFGKWANIRNDIPKSTVKNTGMFKELIAGDPMKAEKKNKDPFFFNPTAKHLFSANQLPEMETDDEAFFRRILLVPFPETVPEPERDKHLDDKLRSELPGILNWAVEGLQRLLGSGKFTGDRSPAHTRETWSKWGDSVKRFAKDAIEEGQEEIPKSMVYAAYLQYCREESIPTDTQHAMTRQLKKEGYQDGRAYVDGGQKRVFTNVNWTGRGEELLQAAKSDGDDGGGDPGSAAGLSSFD